MVPFKVLNGLLLVLLWICIATPHAVAASPSADDVLELANEVGNWLLKEAQEQNTGTAWAANALDSSDVAYDLGSGTAGVVVYLLALHEATDDQRFLNAARTGGDYLATLIAEPGDIETASRRASLYSGVAGISVALTLLTRYDIAYATSAEGAVALLDTWNADDDHGVYWSDEFNDLLYGDAGTALFLAWRGRTAGDDKALSLSRAAGQALLSRAESADVGTYWRFRRSQSFNLPGFSHGTAGIAFALGSIGDAADDSALLAAAEDGLSYLDSIAVESESQIRMPYGWPLENWEGLYEFGWAHGLVGHAMFLQRLQQLGIGGSTARSREQQILHTLANINLPGEPAAPFSEPSTPLDWRFGRAAVLALLSDTNTGQETRDAIYMDIADQAIRSDGLAHWEVDAPAFMGGGRAAYTGLLHGSAGIGLALLRLHAALSGRPPYITLPDDPAAWGSVREPN